MFHQYGKKHRLGKGKSASRSSLGGRRLHPQEIENFSPSHPGHPGHPEHEAWVMGVHHGLSGHHEDEYAETHHGGARKGGIGRRLVYPRKHSGQDFNILGHAAKPGGHAGYGRES